MKPVNFDVSFWKIPKPLLAIVGPLMGLGFIIILPITGLVTLILLTGYRAKQGLAIVLHRVSHTTVDA